MGGGVVLVEPDGVIDSASTELTASDSSESVEASRDREIGLLSVTVLSQTTSEHFDRAVVSGLAPNPDGVVEAEANPGVAWVPIVDIATGSCVTCEDGDEISILFDYAFQSMSPCQNYKAKQVKGAAQYLCPDRSRTAVQLPTLVCPGSSTGWKVYGLDCGIRKLAHRTS